MEKQDLKFTDLDYLIADHHLQMIKAALPYVTVSQQKFFSLLVKSSELMRTAQLFQDDGQGEMGICSIEQEHQSPIEMMNAMKPYGTPQEQDMMDVIINIMQGPPDPEKLPGNGLSPGNRVPSGKALSRTYDGKA